jgi:hypothetical protein
MLFYYLVFGFWEERIVAVSNPFGTIYIAIPWYRAPNQFVNFNEFHELLVHTDHQTKLRSLFLGASSENLCYDLLLTVFLTLDPASTFRMPSMRSPSS